MNSHHRILILGSMALLAVAGVIGAFMAGERARPPASSSPSQTRGPAGSKRPEPRKDVASHPAASPVEGNSQTIPPPGAVQVSVAGAPNPSNAAIKEAIHETAITYDPKELPKIQPYLLHPDPEVRAAALDGMLVLGDAAASPLLRAAAKQLSTPQEAVKLLEAADYLELPSGSFRRGTGAQGTSRPAVRQARPSAK